jgi:ParB family transcriptional regulator, chromosome partitioning protein
MSVTLIAVTKIRPNPNQPRKVFSQEAIAELAQSIQENDLLQPVPVEDNGDGTYTLVGGERRWRAFQLLGRENIPAIVREKSNHGGRELLIYGLIENLQRENMNPVDEGEAFHRLYTEYGMSQSQIALKIGKHQAWVSMRISLCKFEPEIKELYRAGRLPNDHDLVRALLKINDRKLRIKLATKIAEKELTARQGLALVQQAIGMIATPLKLDARKRSPALHLAQHRTSKDFDDEREPNGWNALSQLRQVPPWQRVAGCATETCQRCALAAMASEATCGQCPLVDYLTLLVRGG